MANKKQAQSILEKEYKKFFVPSQRASKAENLGPTPYPCHDVKFVESVTTYGVCELAIMKHALVAVPDAELE